MKKDSRKRTIKNVSFADNTYENELLDYATRPEKGPFSTYIKRLIAQDREGVMSLTVKAGTTPSPAPVVRNAPNEKDRSAALDML